LLGSGATLGDINDILGKRKHLLLSLRIGGSMIFIEIRPPSRVLDKYEVELEDKLGYFLVK
jgi:hypothetical protein